MANSINKAVIPVAGLGTRFLPATKSIPKEMLPVVDKPVIQFVVEEAVRAGLNHVLMVTGRNKTTLENHFDRAFELETRLVSNGDDSRINLVAESTELADIHYVRQGDALGLGHAVSKAKTFIGNEAFALLLGDELIHNDEEFLSEMIQLAESTGSNIVGLFEVPDDELYKYGVASISEHDNSGHVSINSLIEKPSVGQAPSNYAVIGRYVLQPEIFRILESLKPGFGGEIQLTDALDVMARNPELAGPVLGIKLKGRRFDMGSQLSFLKATIELACERDDIGEDFSNWLSEYAKQH